MPPALTSPRSRPIWLGISLVAGSLSNVAPIIGAAWSGRPAFVGVLGVLLALYVIALCLTRGLLGESLLLTRISRPSIPAEAAGASLVVGIILGFAALPITLLLLPQQAWAALVLSVSLPILLFQDTLRYVTMYNKAVFHAAAGDLLWLVFATIATMACVATDHTEPGWLVTAWAGSGAVSASYLFVAAKVRPTVHALHGFLLGDRALRLNLAADALLTTGSLNLSILLTASTIGIAGVGIIRFLQTLFGPITLLFGVLYVEFATRSRREANDVAPFKAACRMAVVLIAGTIGLTFLTLAARELLGQNFGGAVLATSLPFLLPFAGSQVAASVGGAAVTGLKLAERTGIAARLRALWAAGLVGGTAVGGATAGINGYIWATTAIHVVAAVAWWHYLPGRPGRPKREMVS